MPALSVISATSNGDNTGSDSTAWTASATTAALADGVDYIVLFSGGACMAQTWNAGTSETRFVFGSTEYGFAAQRVFPFTPPDAALGRPCEGIVRITGNGTDTLAMQHRRVGGNSGDNVITKGTSIIAIPVDELVEGRDYWIEEGANNRTAVLTPAASAAWAAIGDELRVTPIATGNHLVFLTAEAQYQSDGGGDEMTFRPRQTTDPDGSPTTVTMGQGNNNGLIEVRLQADATDPDDLANGFRYVQMVSLTAGTDYDFFLEAEGVDGDTEYRRARYVVFDMAAFGEAAVFEDDTGNQVSSPGTETFGPLTISDPGTAYDYVVIGATSYSNLGSWIRGRLDLNGTDNVTTGGIGSGGDDNGASATSDYHFCSQCWPVNIPATSTPDYEINLDMTCDNTDIPFGYGFGESGGEPTDASIITSVIAWRMEVTRLIGEIESNLPLITMDASVSVAGGGPDVTVDMDTSLPLPTMEVDATVGTQATVDADLPIPTAEVDARILVEASVDTNLPLITADIATTVATAAAVDANLPLPTADIGVTVATSASFDADLPLIEMDAAAVASSAALASMDADLPLPTSDAGVTVATTVAVDATLPLIEMDAATVRGLDASVDTTLPLPTADIATARGLSASVDADLPLPTMDAATVRALSGTVDADLPIPEMDAAAIIVGAPTNAVVDADLPLPTMDAVTTSGLATSMDTDLPIIEADIGVVAAHPATLDADLPLPELDAASVAATAASVDANLPLIEMEAETARGLSAAVDADLPLPVGDATANVTLPPVATMDAELPIPTMDGQARVQVDAAMVAELPVPELDAIVAAATAATMDADLPIPTAEIATSALPNATMDADLPIPTMEATADAPPLPDSGAGGGSIVWSPEVWIPEATAPEVWTPEVWATRAGGDILASLGDTFGGASLDPSWTVEDVNAALDGASGVSGGEYNLRMTAGGAAGAWWFDDNPGILIYKEIVGPFMMRCRVRVRNDADTGAPPTGSLGKYCGIAAHDPDRTVLNYVHVVAGSDAANSIEWKTTDALVGGSTDTTAWDPLTVPPNGTVAVDLQLVRRVSNQQIFDLSYRDATGGHPLASDAVPFIALQTINRTDNTAPGRAANGAAADVAVPLPARLRVGMVGYSVQAVDDVQGFFEEIIVSRDHPSII